MFGSGMEMSEQEEEGDTGGEGVLVLRSSTSDVCRSRIA